MYAAAFHVAGEDDAVADAPSRFSVKASGGGAYPDRELRPRIRAMVVDHCGPMDVDMMSGGTGPSALV